MNSIIIYATSIILKIKPKLWRIILASTIGAIYVIIIYITEFSIYNSLLIKMILSIFIVYIAYNPQSAKKMWKELAIFYLTTFVFGGMALYLIYIIKPQEILIENGIYVGSYAIKVIMLGAIFSFVLIKISFNIIKSKIIPKDMMCIIKIKINDKIIETKAMIDTGNLLKDPITNIPVIVMEYNLFYDILPKEILNNIRKIFWKVF